MEGVLVYLGEEVTDGDWKVYKAFNRDIPRNLISKVMMNKYMALLPDEDRKLIKERVILGKRIDKLMRMNLSKYEMKIKLLEIFTIDPSFQWVASSGFVYENMMRAISDCSNGTNEIYLKAYNFLTQ